MLQDTLRLPDGANITFCKLLAGRLMMGARDGYVDEEPEHQVILTKDFWLGQTPVTQAQFRAWKAEHKNGFSGDDSLPVEQVTWEDSMGYCEWLTTHLIGTSFAGWKACLPTEAQWEYACRAGTTTAYHGGDGAAALREEGWFDENSGGKTHPVGGLAGNAWGLHDMHGNVLEWCLDCFDSDAYAKHMGSESTDPFVSEAMAPNEEDTMVAVYRRRAAVLSRIRGRPAEGDRSVLEDLGRTAYEFSLSSTGQAWGELARSIGKYLRDESMATDDWAVLELWCQMISEQIPASTDPTRVVRGGSWRARAWDCRAAYRYWAAPGFEFKTLGFRICLNPSS